MDKPIPFILSGNYFAIIDSEGNSVRAKCVMCASNGREKAIKGALNATSNFLDHLKGAHPEILESYKNELKGRKRPRISVEYSAESILNHVTIDHDRSMTRVDKLIVNFVVKGMHPLSIVDQPEFRELLKGLKPDVEILNRQTLTRRISVCFDNKRKELIHRFTTIDYLCITADIWTCDGKSRSFMGVTAHWILNDFSRQGVALACRRFRGSHTFETIAQVLTDILKEYDIPISKVVKAVTDNASNFGKAFRLFGMSPMENETRCADSDDIVDIEDIGLEGDDDVVYEDLDAILHIAEHNEETLYKLPPHQKCASHTLSLICTEDIPKLSSRLHKSALAKCSGLWNKLGRSSKIAEAVKDITKTTLKRPCVTRWNSMYDSLVSLLAKEENLDEICGICKVPKFLDREVVYLKEYVLCVEPIALALDKLQAENNLFYGALIPTLMGVEKKLARIDQSKFKEIDNLVQCLLNSLRRRFHECLELSETVKDAIVASISHPFHKLRWIPEAKRDELKQLFVNVVISENSTSNQPLPTPLNSHPVQSGDFYEYDDYGLEYDSTNSQEQEIMHECYAYFNEKATDVGILQKYPSIKTVFIKFNTPLASSAPVERLFNYSKMVFSPKRRRLTDVNFERLTLLRVNGVN